MLKIIVFLVAACIAYFVYSHWSSWTKPFTAAVTAAEGPHAVRLVTRNSTDGPFDVEIVLMSGKRWRVEAKSHRAAGIVVAICDGINTVSNAPGRPTSSLDPRGEITGILSTAAAAKALLATSHPPLEQVDGHTCVKTTSVTTQVWIDSTTGFPVYFIFHSTDGSYRETHFSRIPIDFTQSGTEEFFNTAHTAPFFTSYLNP